MSIPPQDSRSPFRQQRWVEATNHDDDLGPYALVAIVGATHDDETGQTSLNVELPADDTPIANLAISHLQTGNSGYELHVTLDFPAYVQYDTGDGTPANDEEWGPEAGSQKIHKGKPGFIICGDADPERGLVRVVKKGDGGLIRFVLTSDLILSGTANALLCDIAWQPTATAIVVRDPFVAPGVWQAYTGYQGWATMGAQGVYDIVFMERPALFIEFTLTADLSSGSATATATDYFQGKSLGGTVTVHDPQALFPKAFTGANGKAVWDDRTRRYEVVVCQQMGTLFWAIAQSNFCPTDDTVPLLGEAPLGAYQHSIFNQLPNPQPTEASNFYHFAGMSGDRLLLAYDVNSDSYDVVAVEPHEILDIRSIALTCDAETGQARLVATGKKFYAQTCDEDLERDLGAIGTTFDAVNNVVVAGGQLLVGFTTLTVLCIGDSYTETADTFVNCESSGSS